MKNSSASNLGAVLRRLSIAAQLRVLCGLLIVSVVPAQAADLGYLKRMPDPQRVLAGIHGSDKFDTAARQAAAMMRLYDVALSVSLGRDAPGGSRFTPEEKELNGRYLNAASEVARRVYQVLDPTNKERYKGSPRWKWNELRDSYARNSAFIDEVLKKHLPSDVYARYMTIVAERKAKSAAEKEARLEKQRAAERQKLYATAQMVAVPLIYLVSLIAVIVFRLRGRVELDQADPRKLLAVNKRYTIFIHNGAVLSPTKNLEVRTHVSGSGYASGGGGYVSGGYVHSTPAQAHMSVSSTTETLEHLQFFLKRDDGREIAIKLLDSGLALRDGHRLSAVNAIEEGKSSGPYLLFRNHSTSQLVYFDGVLNRIVMPGKWGERVIKLLSLPLLFIPLLVYGPVRNAVAKRRVEAIKRQIGERIVPLLDSQAEGARA